MSAAAAEVIVALDDITEEEPRGNDDDGKDSYSSTSTMSEFDHGHYHVTPVETTGPLFGDSWRLPEEEEEDSPRSQQSDRYSSTQSSPRRAARHNSGSALGDFWFDLESEGERRGLSPPPPVRKS